MNAIYLALVALSTPFIASSADRAGTPAIPLSFVENRGQAEPSVRYLGQSGEATILFRAAGVTIESGGRRATLSFRGSEPSVRIVGSEPAGGVFNYLGGADPAGWTSGIPILQVIDYIGIWPGITLRFRASGVGLETECVVSPGASTDVIGFGVDGDNGMFADNWTQVAPHAFRPQAGTHHALAPMINPSVLLSGYFGGFSQTTVTGVAINSNYNIVTAGWTLANNLRTSGGAQTTSGGGVDAFVAIFSASGGSLLSCTYLGGSGDDRAFALAVDSANYIYVTGWTQSKNFPTLGAYQTKLGGARDAWVAKLTPTAGSIVFSTYFGGSGTEAGYGLILDSTNSPIIVGDTTSTNLPVTTGAAQRVNGGGQDAFVAKFNSTGSVLSAMTYYGGLAAEHATSVTLDGSGNIYFGGSTNSQDFPVVAAAQSRPGGGQDAFLVKLSPDAKTVGFATYLGGSGGSPGAPEQVNALIFSVDNRVNAVGSTASVDFPITAGAIQPIYGGGNTDGFYARLDPTGRIIRSTFLGGSSDDAINAITADYDGYYYLAGNTTSSDFPVKNATQGAIAGGMDAFVIKMLGTKIIYGTYLGGTFADSANGIAVDSLTNVVVAGLTSSSNFPVSGGIGGWQGSQLSSFVTKLTPPYTLGLTAMPVIYTDVYHTTGFNSPVAVNTYGVSSDIPVVGDWDGSGIKRLGVFRNGTWILDTNGNGVLDAADKTVAFGQTGDLPVVGDWNGTGRMKLGLFRQGTFILDLSGHLTGIATGLADASFPFGQPGDLPVAGDWTQSGTTKVGTFRNGTWLLDYNGNMAFDAGDKTYTFGQTGDLPVVGDWSGSGTAKIGVFRGGYWILDYDGLGYISSTVWFTQVLAFGSSAYKPLVW